ncbi:ubiquinone biosynthesis methyltransferase UbiE [Brachybacterium endophyticum]|uniref:Ubiquinone biosynthesis methyltransferase UbiE n=1 Tax=Brachybacterium endophyticum TaxID=2182385 RepID=A0A2U2RM94_9MICO|nr:ubiquinone biosynthesis methyltransferase UbiE [Brachybacterium endophyticum]
MSDLFTAGAHRYDLLVGANPGYHRHLDTAAGRLARDARPQRVLDLGCGTGASTAAILRAAPWASVRGVDASAGMVERARAKQWPPGQVEFAQGMAGDAEVMAGEEGERPYDACLAAYLLRNVPPHDRTAVLRSVGEQLREGGALAIQDYSVAGSRRAALVWHLVCWLVVIPLSALTLGDTRLYRYLWRSVREMEDVGSWRARLREAGFEPVAVHPGSGWQRDLLHTVIAVRR